MQIDLNEESTIELIEGDITLLDVDAVVNAANQHLQLGAGVAGAIRRRGGPTIQQACDAIGYCPVGEAVITHGGTLPARYVIHAVGPVGADPQADALLASATRACLRVAEENQLSSVAFPAISTGIFGFPLDRCARIMLPIAVDHLRQPVPNLKRIIFCLFGQQAFDIFAAELSRILPRS